MAEDTTHDNNMQTFDESDSELPPLPATDGDEEQSLVEGVRDIDDNPLEGDESAMSEGEMKRKLMDIESSFLPDQSTGDAIQPTGGAPGADDTFLFGSKPTTTNGIADDSEEITEQWARRRATNRSNSPTSPATPSEDYQTPAPIRQYFSKNDEENFGTTPAISKETPSSGAVQSSPTAAAAERGLSRISSVQGHKSPSQEISPERDTNQSDTTTDDHRRSASRASTVRGEANADGEKTPKAEAKDAELENGAKMSEESHASNRLLKRPSFLKSRFASQRSSTSSVTNRSDLSMDVPSDGTIGADYALQSGGALPSSGLENGTVHNLPRLPSLSSVTSSISGAGESTNNASRGSSKPSGLMSLHRSKSLAPLNEEDCGPSSHSPPATPRSSATKITPPTDTVIAQHVQNIQVPDTVVRAYKEKHASTSPEKGNRTLSFSSKGRSTLTLKEQNSKLDKLSKENFDLKLKIHFLDQALQNRSDEGYSETISKNVQLQTDLVNEKKENQILRRQVRDLERRLQASEDEENTARPGSRDRDGAQSSNSALQAELEEEIMYLRECLEQSETQVDELRENTAAKEMEKRRLSEFVKTIGDKKPSEPNYGFEESIVSISYYSFHLPYRYICLFLCKLNR